MSRNRILLAHRDRGLAKSLQLAVPQTPHLEWAGFAASEQQVMQSCLTHSVDLILLDTSLDDAPALSVMHAVQRLERSPKIVGFADSSDPAMVRALLRAGARGYILATEPLMESLAALSQIFSNKIVLSSSLISSLAD